MPTISEVAKNAIGATIWPYIPEGPRRRIRAALRIIGASPIIMDPSSAMDQRYQDVLADNAPSLRDNEIELHTPAEVDHMVGLAHHAAKYKGEAGLSAFIDSVKYKFPKPVGDPFSTDYRDFWMRQYEEMSRKIYAIENEHHDFDQEILRLSPYPYNTRDQKVIAAHLIAAGYILEAIPAAPPARILELGVGFGNTSLQLGMSGYDMTVLDIEKKFLDVVAERFAREGLKVRCLHMQFLDIDQLDDQFDAIVFYECFHHCIDHGKLLSILKERLLPGGAIVFAGETVNENVPYAWGLNPMGQGIWSIRHFGWMELVFKESYFLELLKRAGFSVTKNKKPHSAHSVVFTARLQN